MKKPLFQLENIAFETDLKQEPKVLAVSKYEAHCPDIEDATFLVWTAIAAGAAGISGLLGLLDEHFKKGDKKEGGKDGCNCWFHAEHVAKCGPYDCDCYFDSGKSCD